MLCLYHFCEPNSSDFFLNLVWCCQAANNSLRSREAATELTGARASRLHRLGCGLPGCNRDGCAPVRSVAAPQLPSIKILQGFSLSSLKLTHYRPAEALASRYHLAVNCQASPIRFPL